MIPQKTTTRVGAPNGPYEKDSTGINSAGGKQLSLMIPSLDDWVREGTPFGSALKSGQSSHHGRTSVFSPTAEFEENAGRLLVPSIISDNLYGNGATITKRPILSPSALPPGSPYVPFHQPFGLDSGNTHCTGNDGIDGKSEGNNSPDFVRWVMTPKNQLTSASALPQQAPAMATTATGGDGANPANLVVKQHAPFHPSSMFESRAARCHNVNIDKVPTHLHYEVCAVVLE